MDSLELDDKISSKIMHTIIIRYFPQYTVEVKSRHPFFDVQQ